jgi:hypothetical protein
VKIRVAVILVGPVGPFQPSISVCSADEDVVPQLWGRAGVAEGKSFGTCGKAMSAIDADTVL